MTRSLLAIPVLVVALVAAGCGEAEEAAVPDKNPLAALDLAAKRTSDVESMRQAFTMEADLGGEEMSLEGEGSFTADGRNGVMTASMLSEGERVKFRAIAADGLVFIKSDDFPLPVGKEWLKTEDPPTSTMKPDEFVRHLRESQGAKNVGTEEVRGEQTTHFRGPLDLEKLVKASGENEVIERLRQTPDAKSYDIVIDVWVLEDGLPARIGMKVTAPEKVSGAMTMTADILKYDVPVDAEAPPAGKVATFADLQGA